MRDRSQIAKRLMTARATVRELERRGAGCSDAHPLESARLHVYRAAAQALAWALEIDLNQMDIPASLLSLEEQPRSVQLHRLELGEPPHTLVMWLAEIPAHDDAGGPDYSTESWSCFLHDEQARQLLAALSAALSSQPLQPIQPIQPIQMPLLHPAASASASAANGGASGGASGGRRLTVMASPPEPDVAGGYADYAGVARLAPSALSGDDAAADDADDADDDDEPPAFSAAAPGGRGPHAPRGA